MRNWRLRRRLLARCSRLTGLAGYDLMPSYVAVRRRLLSRAGIDIVIDIGANTGQYGAELRRSGYSGKIVSFEPIGECYKKLVNRSEGDPKWKARPFAVGEHEGETEIRVSANLVSSSIAEARDLVENAEPEARTVRCEKITMKRLDQIFGEQVADGERAYLKIDAQGYTKRILCGARAVLERFAGLELEMSLTELYEQEYTIDELLAIVYELGFRMVAVRPGFMDEAGDRLLEMDGIFYRRL